MRQLTPDELADLLASPSPPLLLVHRPVDGGPVPHLPGSLVLDRDTLEVVARALRPGELVVVCDAQGDRRTAAEVALDLSARGVTRVALLLGGVEAWAASGRRVEGPTEH